MLIAVEDVDVTFGDRRVLQGFSATFPENQITAVTGPSGSGKSTLLGVIAGAIQPQHGRILFEGRPTTRSGRRARTVWVPQGSNSLPGRTVVDNAALAVLSRGLPIAKARSRARELLALVGLVDLAQERAATLSGGELQRLAFARALGSERPIVLADEPSANLDLEQTTILGDILTSLRGQATIVIASHDPMLTRVGQSELALR